MSNERWHADGGTVRDENGLPVAHVVGQDEDNSDALLIAAAPELKDRLIELLDMLDGGAPLDTGPARSLLDRISGRQS